MKLAKKFYNFLCTWGEAVYEARSKSVIYRMY